MKRVLLTLGVAMLSGMVVLAADLFQRDNVPPLSTWTSPSSTRSS